MVFEGYTRNLKWKKNNNNIQFWLVVWLMMREHVSQPNLGVWAENKSFVMNSEGFSVFFTFYQSSNKQFNFRWCDFCFSACLMVCVCCDVDKFLFSYIERKKNKIEIHLLSFMYIPLYNESGVGPFRLGIEKK